MSSTRNDKRTPSHARLRRQTERIRAAISGIDFVVSGHVHSRTKVCGRPNCRCAQNPDARHGPYYEWSRREDGKQRHSVVTPEQAQLLTQGIDNRRRIETLLADWEGASKKEILEPDDD
jgi:hypothetical protein